MKQLFGEVSYKVPSRKSHDIKWDINLDAMGDTTKMGFVKTELFFFWTIAIVQMVFILFA